MPSNSTKTTGTTTQTPQIPGASTVLGTANNVFNSGAAWAPNTTSMVSPFSSQSQTAFQGMDDYARRAIPYLGQNLSAVGIAQHDLGSNGLTDLQDQQVGRLQNQASGGMLQHNPYLDDVIKRSSQDIAGANALTASGAGRYGSGMAQDVTERNIGDMSSNLRYQDYGKERGYMQDAIGSLYNAGQQGLGNINGGADAIQNAYQGVLSPYQTMAGIGSQYENKNTQVLQDNARQFQERKDSQTDPVDWLANLGRMYGGGTTQTGTPYNPVQSGIGGGLSAFGATGNPFMGLLGGLGGLL